MELIKKLNESIKYGKKQRRLGLFSCDYCNQKVKKEICGGLRAKSCGCYREKLIAQKNTTHGFTKNGKDHPLYRIWISMRSRCSNKNDLAYKYYGKRGIIVCERWQNDFVVFYKWAMENNYKAGLDIDRRDNNGNYKPSNCRWTTRAVNQQNSRNAKLNWNVIKIIRAEYKKRKDRKMVAELAKQYGVSKTTIRKILNNLTWKEINNE